VAGPRVGDAVIKTAARRKRNNENITPTGDVTSYVLITFH